MSGPFRAKVRGFPPKLNPPFQGNLFTGVAEPPPSYPFPDAYWSFGTTATAGEELTPTVSTTVAGAAMRLFTRYSKTNNVGTFGKRSYPLDGTEEFDSLQMYTQPTVSVAGFSVCFVISAPSFSGSRAVSRWFDNVNSKYPGLQALNAGATWTLQASGSTLVSGIAFDNAQHLIVDSLYVSGGNVEREISFDGGAPIAAPNIASPFNPSNLLFGADYPSYTQKFIGEYGEFASWQSAKLTAEEITALYAQVSAGQPIAS